MEILEEDEKSFLNVSLLESSYCTDEIHREKVPYRRKYFRIL